MLFPVNLKKKCLRIAQNGSPYDTGNLVRNAIQGSSWTSDNKFKVKFSSNEAPYVEILQDSTWQGKTIKRDNKHKGFINIIVANMTTMLVDYYDNGVVTRVPKLKKDNDLYEIDRRIRVYKRSIAMSEMLREAEKQNE